MADSLVLTGVKDVKKHTGTEMLLTRPKRGGDTHSLKEWWKGSGVSTCYVECSVFDVTTGAGTVKLVLDSNMSTNVRIDHDGSFNFTFIGINEVSRGALFTESYELIEHYVFPRISGGKVMTVTPAGGAVRPNVPVPPTGVVTGASISNAGTGYTAGQNGVSVGGGSGSGMTINFGSDGDAINSVTVVSGGQDYVNGETVTVPGGTDGELTVVV
jgi:hypothetical protein